MRVDVLCFDGCPSYAALMPRLHQLVADAGLPRDAVTLVRVESLEDAEAQRFLGSPTVRIDGVDVDPAASDRRDFGLKCRIYRADGQQLQTPPDAWIAARLASAATT